MSAGFEGTSAGPFNFLGASLITALLPVSFLAIGAAALFADGDLSSATDLGLIAGACAVLAMLRRFRPRGVVLSAKRLENRTGMFRRDAIDWAEVQGIRQEWPGVLVVTAIGSGHRDIVVRGSDELASIIGEREGPSLEQPIRQAVAKYQRAVGEERQADQAQASANGIIQWLLVAVCAALVLASGLVVLRLVGDVLPNWHGPLRRIMFVCAGVAAFAPAATVPGWIGPRMPKHLADLVGWRKASDLLPFILPWVVLGATRIA
jgi:hypothetical protein